MRVLTVAALVLIVLGLSFLVVGTKWRGWAGRSTWPEDKAVALSVSRNKMHGLHHEMAEHSAEMSAAAQEEYTAAKKEQDRLEAELSSADGRLTFASWCFYLGGVLCLISGGGLAVLDQMRSDSE